MCTPKKAPRVEKIFMHTKVAIHLPHSKFLSPMCTTTPCPIVGWPPVTWKESDAHVPLIVLAARAPTHDSSPTTLLTCL
ncbi:unnamed protein product [Spirodela intermedia]|uniref:Uncharacterized protein n=1 Tax=Spirodela intermedia TaxID=51605 RepID=A0A7I8KSX9_SPIIN|nr:unnamed protein product [Spirodela intermedia]